MSEGRPDATDVCADLAGSVWRILAQAGARVARDEEIIILESMKMEIPVLSPVDGTLDEIAVVEGDAVEAGALLARVSAG